MSEAEVRELLLPCTKLVGGIIHACHRLMHEFGYISDVQTRILADVFNLSVAEVKGTISFYHDFRTAPPPRNRIRICRAEACQANRVDTLVAKIEKCVKRAIPCTSLDGHTEISYVYCLGLCAIGPAAEINGKLMAPVSAEQLLAHL